MSSRMCFLIMAHERFQQLSRLLQALEDPAFDVYLHVDKGSKCHEYVSGEVHRIYPTVQCHWGAFSILQATLKLLRAAFESDVDYRYYTLLSGADYPIRSNQMIYRLLSQSDAEFLSIYDGDNSFRHNWYHKFHFNEQSYWTRRILHLFLHRMQGRVWPNRKIPLEMEPFWGSQWWSLTHSAVEYIFEFLDENPGFLPFFRYTHASDELFFHTILMNSHFRAKIEPNLHYIDWEAGGSHPKILKDGDFNLFSKGTWMFARKFNSDETPGLLDRIDRELRI